MKNTPSASAGFPLARIHRLLRPLRASLGALESQLTTSQPPPTTTSTTPRLYAEPKANRRAREDAQEYAASSSRPLKRYRRSNHTTTKRTTPTHPASSPLFSNPPTPTTTTTVRPQEHPQVTELDTQIRIDKLILAYKNILDATTTTPEPDQQLGKLATVCARVIGRFIERAIELDAGWLADSAQPPSLLTDVDWKTSVMDEWYDAIPLLYRRYALAQHALAIILRAFPLDHKPHAKRAGLSHAQKLVQALHALHRSYAGPAIQAQALLLLPALFGLPTRTWGEICDDYEHRFALGEHCRARLVAAQAGRTFLEICSDRELVALLDLAIHRLAGWAFERWLVQRDALVLARARWRRGQEARLAGLESDDEDDDEGPGGMEEEAVVEYDRQSSPILLKWISSLVAACVPSSIHCAAARSQLSAISRLLFDALMAASPPSPHTLCSEQDNYFLALLSITVESHRLALFGLPIFNTGSVTPEDDEAASTSSGDGKWSSSHAPMRLQVLIAKFDSPDGASSSSSSSSSSSEGGDRTETKIFGKAAKLFFRAHRTTRLLAVPPGLLSSPGGAEEEEEEEERGRVPGLAELFRSVVEGPYALERLARSWARSLLHADPALWALHALPPSDPPADQRRRAEKLAADVQAWLRHWLALIDDAHSLRHADDFPAHLPSPEAEDDDDEKPPAACCTCPSAPPLLLAPDEEEDTKPPAAPAEDDGGQKRPHPTQPRPQQVRVVVPATARVPAGARRKKRAPRLSLPAARRRLSKSLTPAAAAPSSGSGSTTRAAAVAAHSRPAAPPSTRPARLASLDDDDEEDDFDAMDLLALPPRAASVTAARSLEALPARPTPSKP